MKYGHSLLRNKIENLADEKVITIFAESKGALTMNEIFSFGNGGREQSTGYAVMFLGCILGMSLSCDRRTGDVYLGIIVNGEEKYGYKNSLINNRPRKHDNFDTPLEFTAGSVINFVSMSDNLNALNTVASLFIELNKV